MKAIDKRHQPTWRGIDLETRGVREVRFTMMLTILLMIATATIFWRAARGADRFEYYSNAELESHTTPAGAVIRYSYDRVGRFTGLQVPGKPSVEFAYDRQGHLISITEDSISSVCMKCV